MTRKQPEPNYDIMFRSAVTALQTTYAAYKVAREKELQMSWYGDDGAYCELEGIGKYRIEASNLLKKIKWLEGEVERLRGLRDDRLHQQTGGD